MSLGVSGEHVYEVKKIDADYIKSILDQVTDDLMDLMNDRDGISEI